MSKKLYIKTFGCQMNEYDSSMMADVLRESHGYELTEAPEDADLLLVNTCSIREKAQEKVFSQLGAAQQVSSRYQNLSEAGIEVRDSRSKKLIRNYRNSKDVLRAAHEVLINNITEEMLDREDFEVLDPEYSVFEGTLPVLLSATDHTTELQCALTYAAQYVRDNPGSKACIALAGYSLYEIENWAAPLGLPVLNGQTGLDYGFIFVSDLEQAKGFEFDMVCIVYCRKDQLPKEGDAVHAWHLDVEGDHVRLDFAHASRSLEGIRRGPDHLDLGVALGFPSL